MVRDKNSVEFIVNNKKYYIRNDDGIFSFSLLVEDNIYEKYLIKYLNNKTEYYGFYNKMTDGWDYMCIIVPKILKFGIHYKMGQTYNHIRNGIKYIEFRHIYFMCSYMVENNIMMKDIVSHIVNIFADSQLSYKLIL